MEVMNVYTNNGKALVVIENGKCYLCRDLSTLESPKDRYCCRIERLIGNVAFLPFGKNVKLIAYDEEGKKALERLKSVFGESDEELAKAVGFGDPEFFRDVKRILNTIDLTPHIKAKTLSQRSYSLYICETLHGEKKAVLEISSADCEDAGIERIAITWPLLEVLKVVVSILQ